MTTRSLRPSPAAALAVVLSLAACAPLQAQGGGSTPAHAHPAATTRAKGHVEADVHFVQGMIHHHEQALVMAAMAPTHGASERLQLLARKIDLSQRDEIASMKRWLEDRRIPPSDPQHAHHAMHMPGMLTAEQLAALDRARGEAFDRLFLELMIQHHLGALQMVKDLFDAPGGGQEPELFQLATDVDADQRAEIDLMQRMLDTLPTTRSQPR